MVYLVFNSNSTGGFKDLQSHDFSIENLNFELLKSAKGFLFYRKLVY